MILSNKCFFSSCSQNTPYLVITGELLGIYFEYHIEINSAIKGLHANNKGTSYFE